MMVIDSIKWIIYRKAAVELKFSLIFAAMNDAVGPLGASF